ncbi:hypothetical protein ACIGZJ_30705 [Kitasatospora sp. NPDC052868]|uniref:hypothetical protein n=1 Tax=Kitasatospora sp. NPDC052868 TaxID=3364060 RepID=UPI0037C71CB1
MATTEPRAGAMICWDHPRGHERDPECAAHANDAWELIHWGRCRSGKRWFWAAKAFGQEDPAHGWEDTEDRAVAAARAAAAALASEGPTLAFRVEGVASDALRRINTAKREQRPGKAGPGAVREFLYALVLRDGEQKLVSFAITKKTDRRIYYLDRRDRLRYVDRQAIESAGEVANRSRGWWEDDFRLHLNPPPLPERIGEQPDDLCELKRAMADAHPDRGGTSEDFQEARERYVRARQHAG